MIDPFSGGRSSERGRTPAVGLPTNDKTKLWIFAILFVVILASFVGLRFWGNRATQESADRINGRPGDIIDVAEPKDAEGRTIFQYVPETPGERRDLVREEVRTRLTELFEEDKLKDGIPEDDPDVLAYLVEETTWNTEVTRVSEFLYRKLDESNVTFEPGPWRGEFASAWGRIVSLAEPMPFGGRVEQVDTLHGATFRSADGQLYQVLSTVPFEREPGDWIQVYGLFYRLRTVTREEREEQAICLALVKNLEIKKAYPPVSVTELDPAWIPQIREGTFEEANNTDERPFWLLLNYARSMGLDGYEKLKAAEGFEIANLGRLAKPLLTKKDEYRFRFVSVRGKIISDFVEVLQSDNPGKIERLDTAFLLQPTEYMVRLVSPRPWSEYGIQVGQEYVQVEGIFYKRWDYVPRRGPPALKIPLLIVTSVTPVRTEASRLMKAIQWAIPLLALGIVGFFLFMAFRDRKQVKEFRARFHEQRRRRLERQDRSSESE